MRSIGIVRHAVPLGSNGGFEEGFNVEILLIRGVAHLDKDNVFFRPHWINKNGVTHFGLHIQIFFGHRGVNGYAAGEQDQECTDRREQG